MLTVEPASAGRGGAKLRPARALPDEKLARSKHDLPQIWRGIFSRLSVSGTRARMYCERARVNKSGVLRELLSDGSIPESRLFEAVAAELGLHCIGKIEPHRLVFRDRDCREMLRDPGHMQPVFFDEGGDRFAVVISPDDDDLLRLSRHLSQHPALAARLRIIAPSVLRQALIDRSSTDIMYHAKFSLFDALPYCSALVVASGAQAMLIGMSLVAIPAITWLMPGYVVIALHILFTVVFFSCVGLRMAALGAAGPLRPPRLQPFDWNALPVYTVLVALYDEAAIVPELLAALDRLRWPRGKLDIKLVCEADDRATLGALSRHALPPHMEVVRVPPDGPRTKPKALAYALPLAKGEFVVLYDAEDKPHPLQLVEAWQRFRADDPSLACVQAPLVISNLGDSLISRTFAFEYAALFRGLLPWLAARTLILPLGGTSNHFRRTVLDKIGGWDPYNVTEDADLGLRLRRFGYRTETIAFPTIEAGPKDFATWLPQRTRWFKGWMQTWLVHMRDPLRLTRELGMPSFIACQILFAGMILSALMHPVLIATAVLVLAGIVTSSVADGWLSPLALIDFANITFGYLAFLLLGRATLGIGERRGFWKVAAFTPLYWLMISYAAWRALLQLLRDPHKWEKTPHPATSPEAADARPRSA